MAFGKVTLFGVRLTDIGWLWTDAALIGLGTNWGFSCHS
jgi:hypothetical protein